MSSPSTFPVSPRAFTLPGLTLERLCALAGVPPAPAFDTEAFFHLWAAAEALGLPREAGLRLGAGGIDGGYGVASLVALHAPDLRRAIEALARYKRLTCPEFIELALEGGEAIVRYRWLEASREVPRLLVDTTTAALHALATRGTAGRVRPIRLELSRRPKDQALLRAHFGCRVIFGAPHEALVFERGALETPFVTSDGGAFSLVLAGLEAQLLDRDPASALVAELKVAIARQLSEGQRATLASVARRMATSARTLQRRLEEHDTSFHEQLASVRRTTSTRLLANTDLDLIAISMLVGFVEPNSFSRAFRAWERTTPLRWRARQPQEHL